MSESDKKAERRNRGVEFLLSLSSPGAYIAASVAVIARQKEALPLTKDERTFIDMPLNLNEWTDGDYSRFRPLIERLASEVTLTSKG